jgi:hypothetical protein
MCLARYEPYSQLIQHFWHCALYALASKAASAVFCAAPVEEEEVGSELEAVVSAAVAGLSAAADVNLSAASARVSNLIIVLGSASFCEAPAEEEEE